MTDIDKRFAGSIPQFYERHLVPLIFESYAADLSRRLAQLRPSRVLETAAGTGVVTRALAATLGDAATLVATDLNQAMLDHAAAVGTCSPVQWRQADAMALPFADSAFDAVVCQFGVMFFPDKAKALAEARRVLRPGGVLIFSAWDRIADNEFADVVTTSLGVMFPQDPPRFLARTPHGYHDCDTIARDLARAGFVNTPRIETITQRSRAASAEVPAIAYCQGTPLRNEIEARNAAALGAATTQATRALVDRFGSGAVDGKIQAHVITIET